MKNVAVISLLLWEYWVKSVSRLKTTYKEQGINITVQHLQKTMLLGTAKAQYSGRCMKINDVTVIHRLQTAGLFILSPLIK